MMDREVEIILRGSQFRRILESHIQELKKKYNVTKAELEILNYLSESGAQNTSSDIHRHLMMTRGHISQSIDKLCKKNYIRVLPDEKDRRFVHCILTESAYVIVDDIQRQIDSMNNCIFEGISEEEMDVFGEIALKVWDNMKKLL